MNNSYLNNLEHEPIRRMSDRRRVKWMAFVVLFIIIIFTVLLTTKKVTATRDGYRIKQVASVEIQNGDTLWSIASRYISDDYNDINDYIAEIMSSNGLATDTIHAGNYIIVPYYADAYR